MGEGGGEGSTALFGLNGTCHWIGYCLQGLSVLSRMNNRVGNWHAPARSGEYENCTSTSHKSLARFGEYDYHIQNI